MSQGIKVPAAKPRDLSSIPGTCRVEGEGLMTPRSCLLALLESCDICAREMHAHICTMNK